MTSGGTGRSDDGSGGVDEPFDPAVKEYSEDPANYSRPEASSPGSDDVSSSSGSDGVKWSPASESIIAAYGSDVDQFTSSPAGERYRETITEAYESDVSSPSSSDVSSSSGGGEPRDFNVFGWLSDRVGGFFGSKNSVAVSELAAAVDNATNTHTEMDTTIGAALQSAAITVAGAVLTKPSAVPEAVLGAAAAAMGIVTGDGKNVGPEPGVTSGYVYQKLPAYYTASERRIVDAGQSELMAGNPNSVRSDNFKPGDIDHDKVGAAAATAVGAELREHNRLWNEGVGLAERQRAEATNLMNAEQRERDDELRRQQEEADQQAAEAEQQERDLMNRPQGRNYAADEQGKSSS